MQNKMLINGAWVDAQNSETWDVINPATEEKVVQVPFGDAKDAFAAIDAAHKAQPVWAAMTAYERSDLLMRVASLIRERVEDIAPVMTLECGKPLIEARLEWASSAALFEWFAEEGKRAYGRTVPARIPGKRLLVIPEPVGVVATITAWNFPAVLPARKWAAALAAGCTVVGRPSELTPLSAMVLVNIMVEAGIPPGVINLVNGEPESIGKAFLESPLVDKVSFTGSQRVGRILMRAAADGIKRLALELGGSAPVLVFNDVDVEAAAMQVVKGKFRNNGQVCISPNRIYVHQPIFNDFVEAAKDNTESLVVGEGLQEGVTTGPLVTAAGRDKVELFVQDALQKGAQLVTGGRRPPAFERGYFFEPTILTNVTPDMRISYDEVFGPAMPVNTFQSFEEAIQLANETPYGLTGYVITNDMSTAIRAYEGLKYGVIGVNDFVPATPEAPFGGMKLSGFGREGSQEGLHEYLETKFVSIAL